MGDFKKQVFFKKLSMDAMDKDSFSLMETLGEYYEKNTKKAPHCFSRYELAKSRLVFYKHKALASLPDYLVEFESGLTASGAKVLYAEDASNAVSEVNKLISSKDTVFVSNDRLVDEIGLISSLEGKNIKCQNSRISNFPYPILPCSSSFFLQLLAKKLDIDNLESTTRQIISLYKSHLLESSFKDAVYISGADFLTADPASVVMLENDGIRNLFSSFCKKQIIIAGIDQIIASISELDYFTSLFSAHTQGGLSSWSQSLFFGPKTAREMDGPEEMYVILVDNGRTRLLKEEIQRSVFNCIHCGACTALCPVFKHVNSSNELYGPLNCVVNPIRDGFDEAGYMAFACTLCGKCTEVCPAKIDFQEMILYNRKESVERDCFTSIRKQQMKLLRKMMLKQKALDSTYNRFILKMAFKKSFGVKKEFPDLSKQSFRLLWQGMQEKKSIA